MSFLSPRALEVPKGPDGRPQGPPPIRWPLALGLLGAVLGSFISNLDTRLTTFSLADLRGGFGYGVDEASWVTTAYNVAEIAIVPFTPWLGGVLSPRRAIAGSVALLTVAGALCPSAPSYTALVALRFLQGLGGGALIPLLLATLLRFLPLHQRVFGFALYALVTAATPMLSETVAGVLTDILDWQAIFYIGVAIGPLVLGLVLFGLPKEPVRLEAFAEADYAGIVLLALASSLLTAALGQGQRLDWFDSPLIDAMFASAGFLLAAFVVVELTREKPLIDLRLLLVGNFTGGLLTIFAFSFATLTTSTVLPQYGMEVRGFRELQVGDILIWAALAQIVVCGLAPFLMRLLDARVVLATGLLMSAIGSRLATFVDSDWVAADILPSHLIQACGQPLIMVPLIVISTSTLQMKDAIAGGTLFNVVRTLAGSIGGAVVGAILTVRERVHSNAIVEHLVAGAPSTVEAQRMGGLAAEARRQAETMAAADAYGWIGVVSVGAMVLALCLRETRMPFPPRLAAAAAAMLVFASAPAGAAPPDAAFDDALAQAYLYNPQLGVERQRLREADEGVPRALSGWRPRLQLNGSSGASAFFDSIDTRNQPERRLPQDGSLALTQPLYTGGRVEGQVRQAEALVTAERAALQASEAAVLLAAGTAFLDVARDEKALELNRNQAAVLDRTARASEQALAAGAVTETDLDQARARLADQRAAEARAQAALGASRATFERQVGKPPGALSLPQRKLDLPASLEAALALVPDGNFDVSQARASREASLQGVDIARAGLLPQVSAELRGERVQDSDVQQFHQRDTIAEGTLQLRLPLYQGGQPEAEIRQAKEAAVRSGLQIELALRIGKEQVQTAWEQLVGARSRVAEYRRSLSANIVAERGVSRQQSVGARTMIEVLNAQQERLAAEVNLVVAEHDEYAAGLQLLAATGRLSAAQLGLNVPLYDPAAHYDATRNRWFGTQPAP